VYQQALVLKEKLIASNEALFSRERRKLQIGSYTPQSLRQTFNKFTNYRPGQPGQADYEYDSLDILLEKVLFLPGRPKESQNRKPGMIRYEATPSRVILELIDSLFLTSDDVFFDLGSGLGLVVILVNLLTGLHCVGIEFDPAYCEYAHRCAKALKLNNTMFIQSDVSIADLNDGNIFYLFTPFVNKIFDDVMERLRFTAIRHQIYVCSYGTITYDLSKIPWLQIRDPAMEHDFKLAIFTSK
jgi:hypothetical protein